jgi:hypothetical protein
VIDTNAALLISQSTFSEKGGTNFQADITAADPPSGRESDKVKIFKSVFQASTTYSGTRFELGIGDQANTLGATAVQTDVPVYKAEGIPFCPAATMVPPTPPESPTPASSLPVSETPLGSGTPLETLPISSLPLASSTPTQSRTPAAPVAYFGETCTTGRKIGVADGAVEVLFCRFVNISWDNNAPPSLIEIADKVLSTLIADCTMITCRGAEWGMMRIDSEIGHIIRTCTRETTSDGRAVFVQLGGFFHESGTDRRVTDCSVYKSFGKHQVNPGGCINASRDPMHMTRVNFTECGQYGAAAIGLYHGSALVQRYELYAEYLWVWNCTGPASIIVEPQERTSYINHSVFVNNRNTEAVIDTGAKLVLSDCIFSGNTGTDIGIRSSLSFAPPMENITITNYPFVVEIRRCSFTKENIYTNNSFVCGTGDDENRWTIAAVPTENLVYNVDGIPFCPARPTQTQSRSPAVTATQSRGFASSVDWRGLSHSFLVTIELAFSLNFETSLVPALSTIYYGTPLPVTVGIGRSFGFASNFEFSSPDLLRSTKFKVTNEYDLTADSEASSDVQETADFRMTVDLSASSDGKLTALLERTVGVKATDVVDGTGDHQTTVNLEPTNAFETVDHKGTADFEVTVLSEFLDSTESGSVIDAITPTGHHNASAAFEASVDLESAAHREATADLSATADGDVSHDFDATSGAKVTNDVDLTADLEVTSSVQKTEDHKVTSDFSLTIQSGTQRI